VTQSASKAENVCLTGVQITSVELGAGCNSSYFQIGFLNDSDWCVRAANDDVGDGRALVNQLQRHAFWPAPSCRDPAALTWSEVVKLTGEGKLVPVDLANFNAASLSVYSSVACRPRPPPWCNVLGAR